MIYGTLQLAVEADPRKKGVMLYRMKQEWINQQSWTWARTSQEALAKVARDIGFIATRHISGVNIDSGGFDGVF